MNPDTDKRFATNRIAAHLRGLLEFDILSERLIGNTKPCFEYKMFTTEYYLFELDRDMLRNFECFCERYKPIKIVNQ